MGERHEGCVNRDPVHLEKFTAAECAAHRSGEARRADGQEWCWNCLHPVRVHADDKGCLAGLYAKTGTVLSMTGCSCALEPLPASGGAP